MEFNIFDTLAGYGSYVEIERRSFNQRELASFKKCSIGPSQYGYSVCFFLYNGLTKYIPLNRESVAGVNEGRIPLGEIDKSRMELVMLKKGDEKPIPRIDIK